MRLGGRLLDRVAGLFNPAFLEVKTCQVDPSIDPAKLGHFAEDRFRLLELALLAPLVPPLEEEADAVVVPALPDLFDGGRLDGHRSLPFEGKLDRVGRHHDDG